MMRPKASSSMQKTYDDCYLMCSTAVYFENQVSTLLSFPLATLPIPRQAGLGRSPVPCRDGGISILSELVADFTILFPPE